VRSGPAVIERPPTHEEIARCVGTNREQVSRVMGELERTGLIRSSRRRWEISNVREVRESTRVGLD